MNECVHYWVIEDPVGKESAGQCKKCGDERVFSNVPHMDGGPIPISLRAEYITLERRMIQDQAVPMRGV